MKKFKRVLLVVMLCGVTTLAFAEDDAAPVYDVDNMPPQFDGGQQMSDPSPQPLAQQPLLQSQEQPVHSSSNVEQRLGKVEQQVSSMEQSTASPKVDQLQNEVQTLRAQVEELNHQLQKLQTQNQNLTAEVDKRISKQIASIKPAAPAKTEPEAVPKEEVDIADKTPSKPMHAAKEPAEAAKPTEAENQPNVAEEQQTYQTAYDLIKEKKYDDAISSLQKMLQKYPSGQFAANAHYWLGELYGLTGKNDQSASEFKSVIQNFSESPKVADAQLKLGLILAGQTKWSEAKSAFKKVINKYPGTASAKLAADQLKQIKQSGH